MRTLTSTVCRGARAAASASTWVRAIGGMISVMAELCASRHGGRSCLWARVQVAPNISSCREVDVLANVVGPVFGFLRQPFQEIVNSFLFYRHKFVRLRGVPDKLVNQPTAVTQTVVVR